MDAPEISVVVLAYRSAATITNFVDSLIDSLEKENLLWEIVLVGNYCESTRPASGVDGRATGATVTDGPGSETSPWCHHEPARHIRSGDWARDWEQRKSNRD